MILAASPPHSSGSGRDDGPRDDDGPPDDDEGAAGDGALGEARPAIAFHSLNAHIGLGATSDVWRARHVLTHEAVAVKVMRPRPFGNLARQEELFLAEARLLRSFTHPNVMKVFDVGRSTDEHPYFSMPLCTPIETQVERADDPLQVLSSFAIDVGAGLAHLHSLDVTHNDLKPANVVHSALGGLTRWVVSDLGLALPMDTPTRPGAGTAPFTAPELHTGAPATRRSDVYAFAQLVAWVAQRLMLGRPEQVRVARALVPAAAVRHLTRPDDVREVVDAVRVALRR